MSKTTAAANAALDYSVKGIAPASNTPYLCLLSSVETPTEVTGGGYAPVAITGSNFGNGASGKAISNTAQIAFPTATADYNAEVIGVAIKNGSSGTTYLRTSYLTPGSYWAFTGNATTDYITAPGNNFSNGQRVVLLGVDDSALPGGVTQGTLYYVINVTGNTFQISTTNGGSAVNLTADGAGKVARVVPLTVSTSFRPTFDAGTLIFKES